LKKYAIELVCLLALLALAGSVVYHCSHKGAANAVSLSVAADTPASTTDWTLILQVVAGVVVAIIGAAPSLYRTYKSGGLQAALSEVEEDAKLIVEKASPILTPSQLTEVKALLDKGHTLVDAYDAVKNPPKP
jgi:uncharacterized protein (UPF0333 family)